MYARMGNVLIGIWLFFSAWIFPHSTAQFTNAIVVSIAVVAVEIIAFFWNQLRFADTVLGLWLILSIWVLPSKSDFTYWNNFAVGVALVVLSMWSTRVRKEPWVPSHRGYQNAP